MLFLETYPFLMIVISFLIGLFVMPSVLKVSIRKQMVVKPNRRTSHKGNIPNVGGINIFTSFLLSYLLFPISEISDDTRFFIAGLFLIFLIGFFDDLIAFSSKKKLLGEILAGFIIIVIADVRLTNLYGFLGITQLTGYGIIISYFASFFLFLLIINALNLIDGVDGLATGIGMLICVFFGIYFQIIGHPDLAIKAYCLIGSLALFFIYNVFGSRSKIFMGDSGSLMLGYIVYVFIVEFCELNQQQPANLFMNAAPAIAACVLAVPLFDTLRVMITRVKKKQSPFVADKNHVHHLLLSTGLKHREVTFILLAVNSSFMILALIGRNWSNSILGSSAVLLAIFYTLFMWRMVDKSKKK